MTYPAAVRRADLLDFDCTPESPRTLVLAALGRHRCEQTDAEDATASVTHLRCHRQRLAGPLFPLLDTARSEIELGELEPHAHDPPGDAPFFASRSALLDEFKGKSVFTEVAREFTQGSDGLSLTESISQLRVQL
jgi:hypothetical protein